MSVIEITKVSADDKPIISAISALAAAVAYPPEGVTATERERWEEKGFLVSAYGETKYAALAAEGRLFAVLEDGEPVAFSVIYTPAQGADKGDAGTQFIREQFGAVPIMKQIATRPGKSRQGFARLLNDHLSGAYPDLAVVAAIVEEPRNMRSELFHTGIGFKKCALFAHPDGKPRGIWCRIPSTKDNGAPNAQSTSPGPSAGDQIDETRV
jgi:hypothetical protein